MDSSMTHSKSLPLLLIALLPFGVLAPACSSETLGEKGQMITCETDPGTGVVLSCQPGGGSGGDNTCTDIDEDGDGEPHDEAEDPSDDSPHTSFSGDDADGDDDDDDDGIDDNDDCDHHPGEDGDDDGGGGGGADLPYDVVPALGATVRPIVDAFAEKGAQPASIVSVTLDGGTWRLAELEAGTPFVVTAADCDHVGNRDVGRDRVVVTWANADGSVESDHLDIRYCGK